MNNLLSFYYDFITTNKGFNKKFKDNPFQNYLAKKYIKFQKYKKGFIGYTIAEDENCMAIAICHPKDAFNPVIAEKIVKGRLLRANGLLKQKNGSFRAPYKIGTPFIFYKSKKVIK